MKALEARDLWIGELTTNGASVATEKLDRNPMARVKRPKSPVRVPKAMGSEQYKQLLEAAAR